MVKQFPLNDLRNFCIVGGGGSGKTSLAEGMLFTTGVTSRLGKTEQGNTVCDYNDDEIDRRTSINSALVSFEHKNKKFNMIDTPGYADFIGETIAAIRVCDTAVLVVDPEIGIDAGTENIWEILSENKKPTIIFINKLDKEELDWEKILSDIENKLEIRLMPLQIPLANSYLDLIAMKTASVTDNKVSLSDYKSGEKKEVDEQVNKYREKLIDTIASSDDALTEKYLEGVQIGEKEINTGLKSGFAQRKIIPVIYGSSINTLGIGALLDFISEYFNPPMVLGKETDPFIGLIFKTTNEPGMGQMNFVRVYSGKLNSGTNILNQTRQTYERATQLCFLQGKKRIETQTISSGDLAAMIKLKDTKTNNIITNEKADKSKGASLELIKFPDTVLDMAIYSKSKGDEEKVGNALASMILEDPTIKFQFKPETREMVVSGMGNLQLEVMLNRIKSRYGVQVELRTPRIPYKETIKGKAEAQGKYKRQSGGRGQYGDCWLKIEPLERGKGFEFVDKIFGGAIPKNYIPSIEKGVTGAMSEGVIAGYPVIDIRVTLYDGSYHEVDSSDMAFKISGAMALRKGVSGARPCILEPIMNMEVIVPEEYLGTILGDLNSRRGRVMGMDRMGKKQKVKAKAPLGEVFLYANDLRSLSKGTGKFSMILSHYEELPAHISKTLIDQYNKSKE